MNIIWSPLAVERASEIAEYITSDNPSAAAEWLAKIFIELKKQRYLFLLSVMAGRYCQLMKYPEPVDGQ